MIFFKKKQLACALILMSAFISVKAQTTIGTGEPPVYGSILEVKNHNANSQNITSEKGLGISRVKLTDKSELYPMYNLLNLPPDYANQKLLHKGLTVWNVNQEFDNGVGLYVWDGTSWIYTQGNSLGFNKYLPTGSKMSYAAYDEDLYLPNCYMVPPINKGQKQTFTFPVKKAYAVWQHYKCPPASTPFKTTGMPAGTYAAKLLWQDSPGLVESVSISSTSLDADATITVMLKKDAPFGNALVALTVDNKVYWSWHIWYTDYKPGCIDVNGGYGEYVANGSGGSVFYHNNSTPGGDYIFMDRNLGANSIDPALTNISGFLYQWGRKDPFPVSYNPIYNINGNQITEERDNPTPGSINFIDINTVSDGANNLHNSIHNPLTYYYSNAPANSYVSWYTNSSRNGNQYELRDINYNLWDEAGRKAPFDPCPEGWRVPTLINGYTPWFYQKPFTINGNTTAPSKFGGVSKNNCISFENDPDYKMGFYPRIQYRDYRGKIQNGYAYFLMSQVRYDLRIPFVYIGYDYYSIYPGATTGNMTIGGSVRCVKYTEE